MGYTVEDVEQTLKAIRYDLTAAQVKLTELNTALAQVLHSAPRKPKTPPPSCPECGVGAGFHAADCSRVIATAPAPRPLEGE